MSKTSKAMISMATIWSWWNLVVDSHMRRIPKVRLYRFLYLYTGGTNVRGLDNSIVSSSVKNVVY